MRLRRREDGPWSVPGQRRFFGTLTLRSPLGQGVNLAVGVRSSTDKSISLQWCCGSRVFVCDNLSFSSERVIARKHTTHGVERYHEAICKEVSAFATTASTKRRAFVRCRARS